MNIRAVVLQQVDYLIERLGPIDHDDACELLRQGLNAIFSLESSGVNGPPPAAFHAIYVGEDGRLTAVVEPLNAQSHVRRWCRTVEDYLGGRLRIEPEKLETAAG
jgi:hypothetical protein